MAEPLSMVGQEPPPPEQPLLRPPNSAATYRSAGVTHEALRHKGTRAATQAAHLLTTWQRRTASARLSALQQKTEQR